MKNILYIYDEYKDNIINNPIYIKIASFLGIKFVENENIAFIIFQLISDENKVMSVDFVMKFDDDDDYFTYYNAYSELSPIGIAKSLKLPSLMQVSCFYKVKNTGEQDSFVLYTKYDSIYKLEFNKSSFLYIMSTFDSIRSLYNLDYNGPYYICNLPNDIKSIKIHSNYTPIVKAVTLHKVGGLFDYFYYGGYIVDFTDYISKNVIRLVCSLAKDKSIKKTMDESKITPQEEFDKLIDNFSNSNIFNPIGSYRLLNSINTEYSLSANTPMSNYTIIAKSNDEEELNIVYLDISADMWANIREQIYNFIEK